MFIREEKKLYGWGERGAGVGGRCSSLRNGEECRGRREGGRGEREYIEHTCTVNCLPRMGGGGVLHGSLYSREPRGGRGDNY